MLFFRVTGYQYHDQLGSEEILDLFDGNLEATKILNK